MGSARRGAWAWQCGLSSASGPRRLVATCCLLLIQLVAPPVSCSASSVITRLPGFHGRLPFYLETGYVGVEEETGVELFYYFVESERSPDVDPLILWLSGGPRCSGFCGLAYEVGPINFVVETYNGSLPQLVYNPYAWTQMASILFLDTPVGSGFSYARDIKGYDVGDISSSLQVVTFLKKWLNDHPRYRSHNFYVGGSSYAGKVIPIIMQYISEEIEQRQRPLISLKLQGYIVGNPVTGSKFDGNFRPKYSHGLGIISDQLYEAAIRNCKGDYVDPKDELCANVLNVINNLMSEVDFGNVLEDRCVYNTPKPSNGDSGRRILVEDHIRLSEPADRPTINCWTYRFYLSYIWMNNNTTRDALKIRKGTIGEWLRCNKKAFPYTMDVPSSLEYFLNLTTRGYRLLVISGDHDLEIPFLSTQAWIRSFNLPIVDDWRAWHVDGQAAGFTITYASNLTFATVKGGGHTAIANKPRQALAMGQRWLDNSPL
uniref:Uncharacterized protein n=1 Tax=Oryza brachyantha TaxID=4533 RepID=J3LSH4_ORYBR